MASVQTRCFSASDFCEYIVGATSVMKATSDKKSSRTLLSWPSTMYTITSVLIYLAKAQRLHTSIEQHSSPFTEFGKPVTVDHRAVPNVPDFTPPRHISQFPKVNQDVVSSRLSASKFWNPAVFHRRGILDRTAGFFLAVAGLSPIAARALTQLEVDPADANKKVLTTKNGGIMYNVIHSDSKYPALVYLPPKITNRKTNNEKLPLLIVLHGAGKNELDVWNLANLQGEHAGLAPSLLANGQAPTDLAENFIVVAPYSYRRLSFYDDSRGDLLKFVSWLQKDNDAGISDFVDLQRVFLFGFSDGATVGVELMMTQRFRGGVFAAYGFTGQFPSLALKLLKDSNLWIFHSKDDVIFPVKCSDNLVASLRKVNGRPDAVRYTRYETDQEGFTGAVKGHSTGITASKSPDIYEWMQGLPVDS